MAHHKQELPMVVILVLRLARNMWWTFCKDLQIHHSYKVTIHCASLFQKSRFSKFQKQALFMVTMFLSNRNEIRKFYRGHSIGVSCKNLALFGQWVSEEIIINRSTRNKNWLWRPCLLTDCDEWAHRCFIQSFGLFGQAISEEKMF